MRFQNDKTLDKFANMDLSQYAGLAVGIVNGKIHFQDPSPQKVLRLLLKQKNKDVALVCVPNRKTAMCI